jgi:hypothetical protein
MNSAVCTLFEGSYHLGLAALVNSLHHAGFRGELFAGYRGALPTWAGAAVAAPLDAWPGARSLDVAADLSLVFLPLDTDYHLTNYKADFMLALLDGPARAADALFYLDPDICVVQPWCYFGEWVSCGVALCEDVNSPLTENHPRRVGWRRYYAQHGLFLRFRAAQQVNGGFVGVHRNDRAFLLGWKQTMDLMATEIGSLSLALTSNASYRSTGFADCFDRTDQDALNAAVEASSQPVSVIGQEAMAFKAGGALLPHAIGGPKPWQANYLRAALAGVPPSPAHKAFWAHVDGPISPYTARALSRKRLALKLASAIGRVVSKA